MTLGSTFGAGCTVSSTAADGPANGSDVITGTLGSGCCLAKGATASVRLAGLTNAPVGNGYVGTPLAPAITVQVQDQAGNPVASSGVTVTLAPSVGEISGASANTDATGKATFNAVVINATALGITLTASSSGLTSTAPSTSFNVTVAVSSGSTLSNNPTDVGGSGVKSVAYYYCAGYSGACTSANWTLIGSTTAANYQVTWTGQPANGAYRVVAVSTDNVSNVSQLSGCPLQLDSTYMATGARSSRSPGSRPGLVGVHVLSSCRCLGAKQVQDAAAAVVDQFLGVARAVVDELCDAGER